MLTTLVTLEPFAVLGNATRTPGSNPARYDLAKNHQRRAEIFADSTELAEVLPGVTSFNSNICKIVIDGYGADLISVASDRVDFHPLAKGWCLLARD
jgi:hypothetical protein